MTSPRKNMQNQLESFPAKIEASGAEIDAMISLVDQEGFKVLVGLLLGEKQALFEQMLLLPLGTPDQDYRMAVTQGQIKGIESIRRTMLEVLSDDDSTYERD